MTQAPSESVELKACPFCGGEPKCPAFSHEAGSKDVWEVECPACCFNIEGEAGRTSAKAQQLAIAAWNARPGTVIGADVSEAMIEAEVALCKQAMRHVQNGNGFQSVIAEDWISFAKALLAMRRAAAPVPTEAPASDGYRDAFYELARMMDIGARPHSPKDVWERVMKPRLAAALEAAGTPKIEVPSSDVVEICEVPFCAVFGCQSGAPSCTGKRAEAAGTSRPVDAGLDWMRGKLRMIISHATGGCLSEPEDIERSTNDICVEISKMRTHLYEQGKEEGAGSLQSRVSRLEEFERICREFKEGAERHNAETLATKTYADICAALTPEPGK